VFYTGEYTGKIVRYDRRTGVFDDRVGDAMLRPWTHPLAGTTHSGSLGTGVHAVDSRRGRLYFGEWMQGRYVYALDLGTLAPAPRLATRSGSVLGVTVDVERDRLLASSMWGLEVVDLNTGAVLRRVRLGLTNRPAVVDRWRDVIYVPSAVDGKIRVLDRDTFELVDQIAIGLGPRYLRLSGDGRRLFASSMRAQFVWELPPAAPRASAPPVL
jgi:outer membrane protein assembly factor BamB